MLLVLWSCWTLAAAGCGSGERKLYHVSGTVTFDGQSIPSGFVLLDPDVSAGNDGTQGFAEIKDGSFDTAGTGKGVTGGAYVMRVRGVAPAHGDEPARMLFREYQQTIDLPAADSRQEIAVPASAGADAGSFPEPT